MSLILPNARFVFVIKKQKTIMVIYTLYMYYNNLHGPEKQKTLNCKFFIEQNASIIG
jgi:hypothetical protein